MPQEAAAMKPEEKAQWDEWTRGYGYWRNRIFIVLWITYGAFYLCRVNYSVAIPGIMKEFGWSRAEMGAIGTALFWAYAAGQFIHGQFAERYSSRIYIFTVIMLSALMNILIGPVAAIGIVAIGAVWMLNGFFQAGGWANCIKTLSQWFPPKARGRRMGVYGASYQFGNVMAWLLAGYLIANHGWRAAFWVPALIFAALGFLNLFLGKNRPEDANLPPIEIFEQYGEFAGMTVEQIRTKIKPKKEQEEHAGFAFTLRQTVGNPRVWAISWSFFCVDIIRYGFLLWAPTFLFEVQKAGISRAAYTAIAIPIFGIAGAIFAGWASDKYFESRRAPIAALMMGALGFLAIFFYYGVPAGAWGLSFITLGLIGFCVLGTQVILIGAVPMDFGTRKAAGAAAGFIDFFGYIGAGLTGIISGLLTDKIGWGAAFWFWIIAAFISSAICFALWRYKPPAGKYL
jgi:OPA family glycerol-3-phosphate transporter-like MFS transporter